MKKVDLGDGILAAASIFNFVGFGMSLGSRDFNQALAFLIVLAVEIVACHLGSQKMKEIDDYQALLKMGEEAKRK